MTDKFRENFFLAVRMVLLLVFGIYIILAHNIIAGASAMMLLLLASFTGAVVLKELSGKKQG